MTTAAELRDKSQDQLSEQLAVLKKEQFNLRFQRASGQLEKTNRVRVVRRDIARIQTILGEWQRHPEAAPHPGARKEKKAAAKKETKAAAAAKPAKEKAPAKKRAKKE